MSEILCFLCSKHLGWYTDHGPGPMYYCDDCKEMEDNDED